MNSLELYFDKKAPNLVNFYASSIYLFHFYLHNYKYFIAISAIYEYFNLKRSLLFLVSSFSMKSRLRGKASWH